MKTETTSAALIPVSATMDTQILRLIQQIDGRRSRRLDKAAADKAAADKAADAHKATCNAIKACIKNISIPRAVSILEAFGYGGDQLCRTPNKWLVTDLLLERYFPDLVGRRADETPIFWFWGGPPNALKWYEGTLWTLLRDRLLFEIYEKSPKAVAEILNVSV